MSSLLAIAPDILAPIPGPLPAGVDVHALDEWFLLGEARRADRFPDSSKKDPKRADWQGAERLATEILTRFSKDLRVGVFLSEAKTRLYGFAGLREGLQILSQLLESFWESGLHPSDDQNYLRQRQRCIEGLNDLLSPAIYLTPLMTRADSGENYSYERYLESRRVGYEKDTLVSGGDGGYSLQVQRQARLDRGEISAEMFEAGIAATSWESAHRLLEACDQAYGEFVHLEDVLAKKFPREANDKHNKVSAPVLSDLRKAIKATQDVLAEVVENKKSTLEPPAAPSADVAQSSPEQEPPTDAIEPPPVLTVPLVSTSSDDEQPEPAPELSKNGFSSWSHAEDLLNDGCVAEGLAEMRSLSAQECGRSRFMRRLAFAEFCLKSEQQRLALSVLEELDRQITDLRLDQWESPELIGKIWGILFRLHRSDYETEERSRQFYQKLCQLDPWQALLWSESPS